MKNKRFGRVAALAAGLTLALSLAACGDNGEPSQQDLQTALSASNELPDPTVQVEKMRCETAPDDKQAWLCEYRFPPADPLKGIFKKSAGAWRHVGPAPGGNAQQ